MGHFYFDESIQERGGFVIGAFVYTPDDLSESVRYALCAAGLQPGVDEFKSGARMSSRPEQAKAREGIRALLSDVKVGVVVVPSEQRPALGSEALAALSKFLAANHLSAMPHEAFFDEGISVSDTALTAFLASAGVCCGVHRNQDSREIGGIQVADLAAHSLGIMLLEHQGHLSKTVKAGENSGYDPNEDISLGFELWASLRSAFFKAPQPFPKGDDPVGDLVFDVSGFGLHVAPTCGHELRKAAVGRFGNCYLGCMH